MTEAVGRQLRAMLEAEGAFFHPRLRACGIPSMGGGMGIVADGGAFPRGGERLARLPPAAIITTRKARLNLALLEAHYGAADASAAAAGESAAGRCEPLPLTAHVWSAGERAALPLPSPGALDAQEERLRAALSPTDTVVCYLLVLAALFGRYAPPAAADAPSAAAAVPFTHESAWAALWVTTLPPQYDNLLELAPGRSLWADAAHTTDAVLRDSRAAAGYPISPAPAAPAHCSANEEDERGDELEGAAVERCLARALPFPRHRAKVAAEQAAMAARHAHCLRTLACLRRLPVAAAGASLPTTTRTSGAGDVRWFRPGAAPASLGHYLWAFNTLMSRGFAYDEGVWAMMPYVDYFNYALRSNASMHTAWPQGSRQRQRQRHGGSAAAVYVDPSAAGGGGGEMEYVFTTVGAVAEGAQVTLHYGAYSDLELLLWYGFTLRPSLLPLLLRAGGGDAGEARDRWAAHRMLLTAAGRRRLYARAYRRATPDALSYADWRAGLQRAFSHVLSPLADTDGDYPPCTRAASWLHDLLAGYDSERGAAAGAGAAEAAVRAFIAEQLLPCWRGRLPAALEPAQMQHCALGALGPSPELLAVLEALADCLRRRPRRPDEGTAPPPPPPPPPRPAALALLLRSLAYMEWRSCGSLPPAAGDSADDACLMSPAAAAAARELSRDAALLLRFLALEATDAEVMRYLAFDEDESDSGEEEAEEEAEESDGE